MPLRLTFLVLRRHPAGWLLAGQLLTVMLYPLMGGAEGARLAAVVFGNLLLALALWVVFRSPLVNWIGWVLAVPAVLVSVGAYVADAPRVLAVAHMLEAAVYFYAATGLIVYMLADAEVTVDELLAAGATFTLLAWGFAFLYSVCQSFAPGSFVTGLNAAPERTWQELLFLSFSVLSGVGLSDITPARPMARSMVMIEMLSGVMYVAIVVSRLVAMASQRRGLGGRKQGVEWRDRTGGAEGSGSGPGGGASGQFPS